MMNRVNFGRLSGTIVDVCKGHGTFLDPGELHRIVEFIRSAASSAPARVSSRISRTRSGKFATRRPGPRTTAAGRIPHRSISGWDTWTFMIGDDS